MPAYWRTLSYESGRLPFHRFCSFHMTGWKIGYCVAPGGPLKAPKYANYQYLTFCVNKASGATGAGDVLRAACRNTIARYPIFTEKRDVLVNALAQSRLKVPPCEGTPYFLLIDYSAVSTLNDAEVLSAANRRSRCRRWSPLLSLRRPFPHQLIMFAFPLNRNQR